MSSRGQHVGSAPTSGIYTPTPTPADNDDLPTYINDELLRLGGILNGILEGGALPPQTKLPKRVREGMIIYFTVPIPNSDVDVAGIWLYRKAKWWKLLDDPSEVLQIVAGEIQRLETDLELLEKDLKELNEVLLPQLDADLKALTKELNDLNTITLPQLEADLKKATDDINLANADLSDLNTELSTLKGKFPITSTEITDGAITTPKITVNTLNGDRILANTLNGDKIIANTIHGDRIIANTLTGDRIITNTLSGDSIVTNTLSGDKIIANTLKGDRVIANTLNGDKIIANTLNGDKIIANTLSGDRLVANSIVGGKIDSATTITAGSGNASAHLDGADDTWRIYAGSATPANAPFRVDKDGNVYAATGTFGGTVYAAKLSGDLVDVVNKDINAITIKGNTKDKTELVKFTVQAQGFNRKLLINPIYFQFNDSDNTKWYYIDLEVDAGTGWELKKRTIVFASSNPKETVTSIPIATDIGNLVSLKYRIVIHSTKTDRAGGVMLRQDIITQVYKKGDSIIFN